MRVFFPELVLVFGGDGDTYELRFVILWILRAVEGLACLRL